MESLVCIPAASPASFRPARAVDTQRRAPQQPTHHQHVDSPHAAVPVQGTDYFPAGAPRYAPDWHPEDFTAQNSSADAHAMASLRQYQQQWHSGTPQMQPHRDPQEFQVQGTSTSWSAPPLPQQQVAASHDWAYQSTPAFQAPGPAFATPVMPQQGGPIMDLFYLAEVNASAMAQTAEHMWWM
jgi:hypothetical protein